MSAGAKVIREYDLTFDAVSSMDADVVDDLFFPREEREPNDAYLQPDMEPLVERKKKNRKLPVKLFFRDCGGFLALRASPPPKKRLRQQEG